MQKPILHIPPEASQSGQQPDKASEDVMSKCLTRTTFSKFMGWSERTTDRLRAQGLLPPADCLLDDSPRWRPSTIERLVMSRPKLTGRGRRRRL
jgi:hypothetical protein